MIAFSSLVLRFRRAGEDERRQILWPLLAISCLAVPWIIGNSVWWVTTITIPLIPAAITLAVLRYRLFGIDTLITRGRWWAPGWSPWSRRCTCWPGPPPACSWPRSTATSGWSRPSAPGCSSTR